MLRRKPTKLIAGRPYRGGACATVDKKSKVESPIKEIPVTVHPIVRRLEEAVIKLLPGESNSRLTRFKLIIRSLATPVALLWETQTGGQRDLSKFLSSFKTTMFKLWSLDASASDLDISTIKYYVGIWMQLGVADVDRETGHKLAVPSETVGVVMRDLPRHLFGGILGQCVARTIVRAQHKSAKATSVLASFLLSKRGWPELCQQSRYDSVTDHQRYLSRVARPLSRDLRAQIEKVITKFVKPTPLYSKLSPSHNASLLTSRQNGGTFAEVMRECADKTVAGSSSDAAPFSWHMPKASPLPSLGGRGPGKPVEASLPSVMRSIDSYRADLWRRVSTIAVTRYQGMRPRPSLAGRNGPTSQHHAVRVVVLPEPGKWRIISAGDAINNTYMQPLQGHMLKSWAVCPYSTMKAGWEDKVAGWIAPEGWVWNSGDYKAATDQLNLHSTLTAIEKVKQVLGLHSFPDLLTGVEIQYSSKVLDPAKGLPTSIQQNNGQLMGHPLSFPLLCFINLSGLLFALEKALESGMLTKEECAFIKKHTIINGDDILFPCPKQFCRIWEQTALSLGLVLNPGKSYASAHFAMVNNVMFMMTPSGGKRIGYLNQKLIYNFCLKGGEAQQSPLEIGNAFNQMFEGFPLTTQFLSDAIQNRKDLPVMGYQPNLFVSTKLGGFGVDPKFATGKPELTVEQRQVAALCAEGVLDSFTIAAGLTTDRRLGKLLKLLPKVRLSSAARGEVYSERLAQMGRIPILFSEETEMGGDPYVVWQALENKNSYLGVVAQFMSVLPPSATKSGKRLKRELLQKVKPMSRRKIEAFQAEWAFPRMPDIRSSVPIYYQGARANKAPRVPTGTHKVLGTRNPDW